MGVGALHQELLPVFPLLFWRGMKEVLSERRVLVGRQSLPERLISIFEGFLFFVFFLYRDVRN